MALAEIILFTISVLPVILLGLYIYNKDKEKESTKLLTKLFLGGIGSCFVAIVISLIIEILFPFMSTDPTKLNLIKLLVRVFIGIALVEEFSKWIMTYLISYNSSEFDELYDAILYATFVALGFACFENLMYVYSSGVGVGVARAILSVPGHACDGVFMGYYLGLSKINALNNRKDLKIINLILSIVVPTVLHGIFDYCLFTGNIIFIIIFLVFIVFIYIHSVKRIKEVSISNKKIVEDKYCPNCGHVIDGNYCPTCGRKHI